MTKQQTSVSSRGLADLLGVYGPALLLAAAGFLVAWQFVEPAPPRQLVMATGAPDGAYHRFGMRYRDILARHGVQLVLRNSAGSAENLQLLTAAADGADVAFMQGGIGADAPQAALESLASLFYEPLWIFQRQPLPTTVPDIVGQRIAIGATGSGTFAAVSRLLEENELPVSSPGIVRLGGEAAADALLAGDVDVAFFVASWEAPYVQRLLLSEGIHIASMLRADAYMRRYHYLASVTLPRGAADLKRDIPPGDVKTLAPVAGLVARAQLHPALVGLLIEAAREIHSSGGMFERAGDFPSAWNTTFPINEDARRFIDRGSPWLQRFLPFWFAVAVDRLLILLIPLVTLAFPLLKILPPTYRWRVRKRIYSHYRHLFEVETALERAPTAADLDACAGQLDAIDHELSNTKVPLAYADQLYHLRTHVRFVRGRVEQARDAAGVSPAGPPGNR